MTIRITAKTDGFFRCGVAHPAKATDHDDDRFDAKQLARLQADPELIVQVVDAPVAVKDGEPPAGEDKTDIKAGKTGAKAVKGDKAA